LHRPYPQRPTCHPRGLSPPRQATPRRDSGAGELILTQDVGKILIAFGLLIVLAGVVLVVAGRVPWIGRLPGDIHIQRGNFNFYFPLATSLLLSVVLSLILYVLGRR